MQPLIAVGDKDISQRLGDADERDEDPTTVIGSPMIGTQLSSNDQRPYRA